jgi:hypothetical protein
MWEFAVELRALEAGGVDTGDLRWLVSRGYAEHGVERTTAGAKRRSFRRDRHLMFTDKSCFILTERGAAFARRMPHGGALAAPTSDHDLGGNPIHMQGAPPTWDRDMRELRLGGVLVKRFKHSASNQELILASFHELGWPKRMDDPLPHAPGTDPKRRLHDTIKKLNHCQTNPLLHFFGDGSGRAICWEMKRNRHHRP